MADDVDAPSEAGCLAVPDNEQASPTSGIEVVDTTAPETLHQFPERIESGLEDLTPLVSPSPVKGAKAFPFPRRTGMRSSITTRSALRHPSALLLHCERIYTPRQRRLMTGGIQKPDRFIPCKAGHQGNFVACEAEAEVHELQKTWSPSWT